MKLEKLYKDIFEAEVGDKLFADLDDAELAAKTKRGFNKDFVKWVENVYGPDYEPNTPEEQEMLFALGSYFGDVKFAKDLGKHVEDLKALKAKFPQMLDPKNAKTGWGGWNEKFKGYAMRGAKISMDQYKKLIRKSELLPSSFESYAIVDNPGITYKSRGQYGFTSFTTDFSQAAKFSRSFKEKDYVNVVYGVKLDDPNLVLNPNFANRISEYPENETLYVGNSIEPDFVVITDPRMEGNFLYDIKAYEAENGLEQFSIKRADFFPKWAKTHTPRFEDFTVDGMPTTDKDKKTRLDETMQLHEIYTDLLREGVWSSSALARMRRKPMDSRYFVTDEEGNVLADWLKTKASVRAYFYRGAKDGGYLGGRIPKVVNVHDNKLDGKVIDQYFWKGKGGIDIDNPTAGSYSEIDPQYVKYQNDIEEGYTDMPISEVGEGTSEPFSYENKSRFDGGSFQYKINGEVRTEDGKFVLQEIPIKLTGRSTSIIMDEDYTDKEILDFFGKNDGTSVNGFEIVFNMIKSFNEFGMVDDRVFMYRLMATIKKILQDEFAKADPDYIVYAPTKQGMENAPDTGRHKLYSAFIKKAIPGAQMFYNKKDDEIIYKLK